MQDLTQGSVPRHIVWLAMPIAFGMVFQVLYYLVDLYFVAQLGDAAIAGVGAGGNVQFIVMAFTHMLGVSTIALVSHAVGCKDRAAANLVFNQSLLLAVVGAIVTLVAGYALSGAYMRTLGADTAAMAAGVEYLYWFLPGLALQFVQVAMGATLRGTGIVMPGIVVQVLTVALNALLAPVLVAGWGTGKALGVAGAGLASSISIAVGVLLMGVYFVRLEKYVAFDPRLLRARLAVLRRILRIGLPPGGEFAQTFVFMAVIYWVIRDFGTEVQAGFGIGSRVMQAVSLPAIAIAYATPAVAGQNFGAGLLERVRETFRAAAWIGSAIMLVLTLLCQWRPEALVHPFTDEPAVIAVGAQFLQIISWNFVASGLIFTCSSMFQALGNTLPVLLSVASRLVTFVLPAIWLADQPWFELRQLWLLSAVTLVLQALVSLWLLRGEMNLRLRVAGA